MPRIERPSKSHRFVLAQARKKRDEKWKKRKRVEEAQRQGEARMAMTSAALLARSKGRRNPPPTEYDMSVFDESAHDPICPDCGVAEIDCMCDEANVKAWTRRRELDPEYEEPDWRDAWWAREVASENPKALLIGVPAVLGMGVLGWVAWRLSQRRKLVRMLEADGRTAGFAGKAGIARERITFTNTTTAAQAFKELAGPAGLLTQLSSYLPEDARKAIGDTVKKAADAESSVLGTGNKVPEYITEANNKYLKTSNTGTDTWKSWFGW